MMCFSLHFFFLLGTLRNNAHYQDKVVYILKLVDGACWIPYMFIERGQLKTKHIS